MDSSSFILGLNFMITKSRSSRDSNPRKLHRDNYYIYIYMYCKLSQIQNFLTYSNRNLTLRLLHGCLSLISPARTMANVCCPIEMEPRTLSQGQLNNAREAAAGVVQTMEPREASNIFVEVMLTRYVYINTRLLTICKMTLRFNALSLNKNNNI